MTDYKQLYLKYKSKYLNAKKMKGGEVAYKFANPKFEKVLNILNNTFLSYFVRDYSNHDGDDVSDHSIWTALAIADWIKTNNNWVSNIDPKYHDILVFSAFIHDIGKTGDGDFTSLLDSSKPEHHNDGVDILLGKKKFITYDNDIDASKNASIIDKNYNDNRILNKPTINASSNIEKYSTNILSFLQSNNFSIEDMVIITMIVGMIDEFIQLVVRPIDIFNEKNKLSVEPLHKTIYASYKRTFNKLFFKIKEHFGITRFNKSRYLSIDKITLTRMCLALSAANVRGARQVKGKLESLPEPTSIYLNSSLPQNSSKYTFEDFDKNYRHVSKIVDTIKLRNKKADVDEDTDDETVEETTDSNVVTEKVKETNTNFCSIQ